ncbi:MAG: hypothetical protein U1F11_05185 [Steroidobacteraceae bacterium]
MVFPFTVFANRKRRIIALKIGELHANERISSWTGSPRSTPAGSIRSRPSP